jgi:sulfur-oxidizing protein SoxY
MKRRLFLKRGLATGVAVFTAAVGLLAPRQLLAAWQAAAFESKNVQDALKNAFGTTQATVSDAVQFKVLPEVAENGAMVPVEITTKLPNVESISILVQNNPTPLAATFTFGPEMNPTIATRVKMSKTSDVIAVVRSGGKLYTARREVKVTVGGCGG